MIPVIVTGILVLGLYSHLSSQQYLSERLEVLKKIRAATPGIGDTDVTEFLPEKSTQALVEFAKHILTDTRCIDQSLYYQLQIMKREGSVIPHQYRLWMTFDHLVLAGRKFCTEEAEFRRILDQEIHAHQYGINQQSLYFDPYWR